MSTRSAEERLAALEAVFTALAHPARRQMLLTVHFRGGSMPAGEIAGRFAHAWPTTTRHLKVLEAAGLLEHEKVGRTVTYRIDRERLAVLHDWLAWFGDLSTERRETRPPPRGRGRRGRKEQRR